MGKNISEVAYEEGFNRGFYTGEYSTIYQNKRLMKILENYSPDVFIKAEAAYKRGSAEGVMVFSEELDNNF